MAADIGIRGVKLRLYCGAAPDLGSQSQYGEFEIIVGQPPRDLSAPCLVLQGKTLFLQVPDGSPPWRPEPLESRTIRRDSLLARAVGVQPGTQLEILDAMAGWGGDGLELVAIGAKVDLVEASALVHALLNERARLSALQPESVRCADAWEVMDGRLWDVIVLDPMFPERGRKGLAKRPMQMLQQLAVTDTRPLDEWITRALAHVRSRVVVKRRRTEGVLGKPAWQIAGTTIRFDVYVPTQVWKVV